MSSSAVASWRRSTVRCRSRPNACRRAGGGIARRAEEPARPGRAGHYQFFFSVAKAGARLIPTIPDVTKAASRWIRPFVPPIIASAVETATKPLRGARQVFEEGKRSCTSR